MMLRVFVSIVAKHCVFSFYATYASIEEPQPDVPLVLIEEAAEEVVDCAAARPAAARTRTCWAYIFASLVRWIDYNVVWIV